MAGFAPASNHPYFSACYNNSLIYLKHSTVYYSLRVVTIGVPALRFDIILPLRML